MRSLRDLGIGSVAVYSEADRNSLHVEWADEAYLLGPPPAAESYLRVDRILEAAKAAGAEAIHPGYGFLAENQGFAQAVADAGLIWIGPPADAMRQMGDKVAARKVAIKAGVPIVAGTPDPIDAAGAKVFAKEHGYPIALKAVMGGGGKAFRVVRSEDELDEAIEGAQREAQAYFGDASMFCERYVDRPRHVEAQILATTTGTSRSSVNATARLSAATRSWSRKRRPPRWTPRSAPRSERPPCRSRDPWATGRPGRSSSSSRRTGSSPSSR